MWPKLLFDLLPHFSRLLPMADKYLASRGATDQAQAASLAALAADVRGELGKVTEAHAGLSRQLQQQGTQVSELAVDVTRARMGVESVEERVAKLEKKAATQVVLLGAAVGLLVVVVALLVVVVVHGRR
jgi:cobalamin biosynthesis Mg chelatase CobN